MSKGAVGAVGGGSAKQKLKPQAGAGCSGMGKSMACNQGLRETNGTRERHQKVPWKFVPLGDKNGGSLRDPQH